MAVRESLHLDISQALAQAEVLGASIKANLDQAGKNLGPSLNQASTGLGQVATQAKAAGASVSEMNTHFGLTDAALKKVGTAGLIVGGAIVGGLALATTAVINFDKEMSNVAAVSGATAAEMDKLRTAALEAGAATVFSASEAATAEAELARAGVSVADIMGGALTGSLNLAAAGQLELGDAATITATALNIFNLEGSDATRVADTLAAGANKSAADVQSLAEGMEQAGPAAATLGISLEETVGTLALLADNGIKGSEAGNTLKRALLELASPTDQQRQIMEDLNLQFFDANGRFIGLAGAAEELKTGLAGLTDQQKLQALSVLGSSFGMQALIQLYNEGGKGVREYTRAVTDSGAAQEFATKQLDNLAGDLERLRGALETALIQGASGATGALRFLTQGVTESVTALGNIDPVLGTIVGGFLALAGVGATAIGVYGTLAPRFREAQQAMINAGGAAKLLGENLGTIARGAAGIGIFFAAFGPLNSLIGDMQLAAVAAGALAGAMTFGLPGAIIGAGLGALAEGMGLLGSETQTTTTYIEELQAATSKLVGGLQGLSTAQVTIDFLKHATGARTFADALDHMRVSTGDYIVLGERQALAMERQQFRTKEGARVLEEFQIIARRDVGIAQQIIDGLDRRGYSTRVLNEELLKAGRSEDEHGNAAERAKGKLDAAAGATDELTGGMNEQAGAVAGATEELEAYADVLDKIFGLSLSEAAANQQMEAGFLGLGKAIDEASRDFDILTEGGNKNAGAFKSQTESILAHAAALREDTGNTQLANDVLGTNILRLIDQGEQLGFAREAVISYIGDILDIPEERITEILLSADPALALIEELKRRLGDVLNPPPPPPIEFHADTDQATGDIAELEARAAALSLRPFLISLDANVDPLDEDVTAAEIRLAELESGTYTPKLDLDAAQAEEEAARIKAFLDSLPQNPPPPVPITADPAPAQLSALSAQAALQGITNVQRYIDIESDAFPVSVASQGAMNAVQDVFRRINVLTDAGPVAGAAQGAMNSVQDVFRRINVLTDAGPVASAAAGAMGSVSDVLRHINVETNAGAVANAAQGAMNGVQSVIRYIDVITRQREGAHGLVGLAAGGAAFGLQRGGSSAGMIVQAGTPVLIGEGLHSEAVVPFGIGAAGDMLATIRNTGHAAQFLVASLKAMGVRGLQHGGSPGPGWRLAEDGTWVPPGFYPQDRPQLPANFGDYLWDAFISDPANQRAFADFIWQAHMSDPANAASWNAWMASMAPTPPSSDLGFLYTKEWGEFIQQAEANTVFELARRHGGEPQYAEFIKRANEMGITPKRLSAGWDEMGGVTINIVVNASGNRQRDLMAARDAGTAAARALLQKVRAS